MDTVCTPPRAPTDPATSPASGAGENTLNRSLDTFRWSIVQAAPRALASTYSASSWVVPPTALPIETAVRQESSSSTPRPDSASAS